MHRQRPTRLNEKQLDVFLKIQAQSIIDNGFVDHDPEAEAIVKDLKKISFRHSDGYEIAKELDDSWGQSYNTSSSFVEHLDCLSSDYSEKLREVVKIWSSEVGIKPKFNNGDRVKNKKSGEIKFIRIFDYDYYNGLAQYGVGNSIDATSHSIQAWEIVDSEYELMSSECSGEG